VRMPQVAGYEKFWQALLSGGMSTSVTMLVLWAVSSVSTTIAAPTPELIVGAISGFVATIFAALGALFATNTPVDAQGQVVRMVPAEGEKPPV